MNCYTKEVIFDLPEQTKVIFCGELQIVSSCLVFASTAFHMIKDGCQAYLAHVVDSTKSIKKIDILFDQLQEIQIFSEIDPRLGYH